MRSFPPWIAVSANEATGVLAISQLVTEERYTGGGCTNRRWLSELA
jgi:hypothetical protein